MKVRSSVGVAIVAVTLGIAGPAAAGTPPGLIEKGAETGFSCGGVPIEVYGGNGRSAWVDGTLYLLRSIEFSGTFDPVDGPPQSESFSKTYGRGPAGDTVTCTASFEEVTPEGTFTGSATARVVAVR